MNLKLNIKKTDKKIEPNSPITNGDVFNDISLNKENRLNLDKITLNEIAEFLNFKSLRTVISWCKRKGIHILKFGKEKYVNLIDFHFAIDSPFIEALKSKFPKDWAIIYSAYKKMDYETIATFLNPISEIRKETFKIKSKSATSFLNKINKQSNV